MILTSEESGPPKGAIRYRIYCPECQRHGEMAGWRYALTGEPVPPEQLHCPDCGVQVVVQGRIDQ